MALRPVLFAASNIDIYFDTLNLCRRELRCNTQVKQNTAHLPKLLSTQGN